MPDLVIREEDGWMEISDLVGENLSGLVIDDLWTFMAEDKENEATDLLNGELGDALSERFGTNYISHVKILECPRSGIRVWAKR